MSGLGRARVPERPPETACARVGRLCRPWSSVIAMVAVIILFVAVIFTVLTFVLPCDENLVIRLNGFTVRDMVVVHVNSTPWEVTSDIDLELAYQNPNSWVRPCGFSLREVELSVYYSGSMISFFDLVYLLSSLKPSSSHKVSATLTGNRSHVSDVAGVALEAQLRRNDNVTFLLNINAHYLQGSNRLLNHKTCLVVVKTPQQTSMRSGDKGFLSTACVESVTEELTVVDVTVSEPVTAVKM